MTVRECECKDTVPSRPLCTEMFTKEGTLPRDAGLASLIPRLLARPGQDAGSEGSRSPARVRRARPGGRETTWRSRHSLVGSRTRRAAPSSLLRLLADGRAAWGEAGRWGWPPGALRASACVAGRLGCSRPWPVAEKRSFRGSSARSHPGKECGSEWAARGGAKGRGGRRRGRLWKGPKLMRRAPAAERLSELGFPPWCGRREPPFPLGVTRGWGGWPIQKRREAARPVPFSKRSQEDGRGPAARSSGTLWRIRTRLPLCQDPEPLCFLRVRLLCALRAGGRRSRWGEDGARLLLLPPARAAGSGEAEPSGGPPYAGRMLESSGCKALKEGVLEKRSDGLLSHMVGSWCY